MKTPKIVLLITSIIALLLMSVAVVAAQDYNRTDGYMVGIAEPPRPHHSGHQHVRSRTSRYHRFL